MREIDSMVGDYDLSQRVGRVVSRDLVARAKTLGHRHQTTCMWGDRWRWRWRDDDGASCLPRSRCFLSIGLEHSLHLNHARWTNALDRVFHHVQLSTVQTQIINATTACRQYWLNTNITMFTNVSSRPQIITAIRLAEFIQHILNNDPRLATLIVCATRERFTEQLLAACIDTQTTATHEARGLSNDEMAETEPVTAETHALLKPPSLSQLANSRNVKLVFCHDLTHLRAYLVTLAIPKPATRLEESNQQQPLLAILNPIDVHRFTTSFSAQGLNRTLALAIEAAHATRKHLVMIEFPECQHREAEQDVEGYELESDAAPAAASVDLWDQEVSILNVTTKSFGAGGRGWVGRTVTIRRIAERWCVFSAFQRQQEEA